MLTSPFLTVNPCKSQIFMVLETFYFHVYHVSCLHPHSFAEISACRKPGPDYDEEARKLFALLNLAPSGAASDASSKLHSTSGGRICWKIPKCLENGFSNPTGFKFQFHTHEHVLYKMTGVKVCYILFYAPPAALLQGVTHPTL